MALLSQLLAQIAGPRPARPYMTAATPVDYTPPSDLLTLDQLNSYREAQFPGDDRQYPDFSNVPAEQQWLARYGSLSPDQLTRMGMYYLGHPIYTDEDFNRAHAMAKANVQGLPRGTDDPTGIWAVPQEYGKRYQLPLVAGLMTAGIAGGLAGAFEGGTTGGAVSGGTTGGTVAGGGSAALAGAGLEAPAGAALTAGGGTVAEETIANLIASGMSPEAAAAAAQSGGATIGTGGGGGLFGGATGTTFGIPNNLLLGGLQAGLGYLGADKQADAYRDVAAQNLALGAPYRAGLAQSYQPGFDLFSQPGYGDAFQRAADVSARSYSRFGNPADNPTSQAGIMKDVWSGSYLPALSNYRGQLGQFGGMGLNTSGQAQLAEAGGAGGGLNAIGYGLNTILNPQPSLDDILAKMAKAQRDARLVV